MKSKLDKIDTKIATLKAQRQDALTALQTNCKHPISEIIESEYREGYYTCDPEFRVCRVCGYAEEGWGCGYWKLAPNKYSGIPQLGHDEAFKHVLKFHTQDDINKLRFR